MLKTEHVSGPVGLRALLERSRVMPLATVHEPAAADELVGAVAAGGLVCIEITLRTPRALEVISAAADSSRLAIGAGTVLTVEQVDRAADAGATFIVSPSLDDEVVERAHRRGLLALPGVATATEVHHAEKIGLRAVKYFPAESLGGNSAIASLARPFPTMRFMPSGGVGPQNMREYLKNSAVFAVSGSWMVRTELIAAGRFDEIARLSSEAAELAATPS